jgi:hypothetical protein
MIKNLSVETARLLSGDDEIPMFAHSSEPTIAIPIVIAFAAQSIATPMVESDVLHDWHLPVGV